MPNIDIHKTQHVRQGKVVRQIGFSQSGEGRGAVYVVFDQEWIEDPLDGNKWKTLFINEYPNRIMARSTYMGLVTAAAYEEFGPQFEEERVERSLSYAKPYWHHQAA